MTLTTEAEHLACFRPSSVVLTSSTDAHGVIFRRTELENATTSERSEASAPSSTERTISTDNVERELEQLFNEFRHDIFEDAVDSDFSRRLMHMIETKGNITLLELNALLRAPHTSPTVAGEALRWLGQMRHRETHAYRRWILADLLRTPSVLVRDGAIVGLLNLDDPSVKHVVQAALESETSEQLREDLAQLLEQLQMPERHYALFAEENTQRTMGS